MLMTSEVIESGIEKRLALGKLQDALHSRAGAGNMSISNVNATNPRVSQRNKSKKFSAPRREKEIRQFGWSNRISINSWTPSHHKLCVWSSIGINAKGPCPLRASARCPTS